MSEVIRNVDSRTNLVGQNRFEMLLFSLGGETQYGINVFKVREVIQCPKLDELLGAPQSIKGVAYLRGEPVPVLDLNLAVGGSESEKRDGQGYVVVTEYSGQVQGFLVSAVDKIIDLQWDAVVPPPAGGRDSFLTSVAKTSEGIIQIIDVERVLADITTDNSHLNSELISEHKPLGSRDQKILVVDDSKVARLQITAALEEMGIEVLVASNGIEAMKILNEVHGKLGADIHKVIPIVISDIEMPQMDGYTLTTDIKNNPAFEGIHIVLHSSLSGSFNQKMVEKVRADSFISKFDPNELAKVINKLIPKQDSRSC